MANEIVQVKVPTNALEVAALQRVAEGDVAAYELVTVDDADDLSFARELLSDVARKRDAAVAMRRTATVPLYETIRTIEGWFKPLVAALERGEKHLKGAIGAYQVREVEREREARELAAHAAEAGDSGALVEALTVASDASMAGGTFAWRVARIADDLVPDEYWCVDRAKIDAVAKAAKGDEPPVVPGVVFERYAKVRATR